MVPGVLTSDWFPLLLLVLSLNNCLAFFCSLKINNYRDLFKGKQCDQAWLTTWLKPNI